MNPFNWGSVFLAIFILILLICSGLISGSEVAFFSLNPSERKSLIQDELPKNKLINQLLNKPRRLLATILVANNFVNIAIILLSTYVLNLTLSFEANVLLQFIFEVVLITTLLLLFGEVIPKVYATSNGLILINIMVYPLIFLSRLFHPIVKILINSTSFIENNVKWKRKNLSSEDLSRALELTSEDQMKDEDQKIFEGIIKFGKTDVKQIMVSRVDVVALNKESDFTEVLEIILNCGFSRIPVYEDTFDKTLGVLYIKDILPFLEKKAPFKWIDLVRKPFFVPENKKIDDLLKEFQEKKIHLAIVVDEYGGVSGIVTLDDILGEIVGDISEEVDDYSGFQKIDENNYLFEGKTPLIDFYKLINAAESDEVEFENAKGESDTLAGFVIEIIGRIPKKLEKIRFSHYLFSVESANIKRVKEIKVTLLNE